MRWKVERLPAHGDKRIIERFLFFPRTIGDETRWLERTRILQTFVISGSYGGIELYWKDEEFLP